MAGYDDAVADLESGQLTPPQTRESEHAHHVGVDTGAGLAERFELTAGEELSLTTNVAAGDRAGHHGD
jgi:hypothetical protein